MNSSGACRNSTPYEDGGRNITRWSHSGKDNITGDLAHQVTDKLLKYLSVELPVGRAIAGIHGYEIKLTYHDCYCSLILGVVQPQISLHTAESCICDVGAIKDVENKEQKKRRN